MPASAASTFELIAVAEFVLTAQDCGYALLRNSVLLCNSERQVVRVPIRGFDSPAVTAFTSTLEVPFRLASWYGDSALVRERRGLWTVIDPQGARVRRIRYEVPPVGTRGDIRTYPPARDGSVLLEVYDYGLTIAERLAKAQTPGPISDSVALILSDSVDWEVEEFVNLTGTVRVVGERQSRIAAIPLTPGVVIAAGPDGYWYGRGDVREIRRIRRVRESTETDVLRLPLTAGPLALETWEAALEDFVQKMEEDSFRIAELAGELEKPRELPLFDGLVVGARRDVWVSMGGSGSRRSWAVVCMDGRLAGIAVLPRSIQLLGVRLPWALGKTPGPPDTLRVYEVRPSDGPGAC